MAMPLRRAPSGLFLFMLSSWPNQRVFCPERSRSSRRNVNLLLASFAKEESWSVHFFAQQGSAAKIWSGNSTADSSEPSSLGRMEGGSSMSEPADMTQTTGLPHQLVPNETRMPNESNQKPECKMHCWLPKSEISKGKSKPGHCREQFALLWWLATICNTQRKPQAE